MSLSKLSPWWKIKSNLTTILIALFILLSILALVLFVALLNEKDIDLKETVLEIAAELSIIDFDEYESYKNRTIEGWIDPIINMTHNLPLNLTTTLIPQPTTTTEIPTTSLDEITQPTSTLPEQNLSSTLPPTTTIDQGASTTTTLPTNASTTIQPTTTLATPTTTTITTTPSTTTLLTTTTILTTTIPVTTTIVTTSLGNVQMLLIYPAHGHATTDENITFSYTPSGIDAPSNCSIYTNLTGQWGVGGVDTTIFSNRLNTFSFFDIDVGTYSWNIECVYEIGERARGIFNNSFVVY